MEIEPDKSELIALAHYKMPFGKFKGAYVIDLPEAYLVWFQRKGFPKGKLGTVLAMALEIKMNGLEPLIRQIQKDVPLE